MCTVRTPCLITSFLPGCRFERGDRESRKYLVPPWKMFDARAITAQAARQHLKFFWNPMHFIPIVYEELNTVLLNMLCDERHGFAEV